MELKTSTENTPQSPPSKITAKVNETDSIKDTKSTNSSENRQKLLYPKHNFKHNFPFVFYNKEITQKILGFLDEKNVKTVKNCLKKTGAKETKKRLKELVRNYVLDFGVHNEKVKYYLNDKGTLILTTNVFNLRKEFLKEFKWILYKEEHLNMSKSEINEYCHIQPKMEICLSNNDANTIKFSKPIIGYDFYIKEKGGKHSKTSDDEKSEEEKERKYQLIYNAPNMQDLKSIDFSSQEQIMQRQKLILEQLNKISVKEEEFYPLKFIANVAHWSVILCEGGYFSYAFYLKDREIEHRSDHKYVIRKKAGVRQIIKDQMKNIKSVGAQIRRANEKKHQENIELILKLNEEQLIKSDCIFIMAPGFNKGILIGDNKPLERYKHKIFNLPYNLKRANYESVTSAFKRLTSVYLEINDENVKGLFK